MPEQRDRLKELNPTQLVVLTFAAACVIGGVLLKLPIATHGGISFVDALFTATSAVCVTGLIVVDTGTKFTDFGKIVILSLIQVGGLGIATYGTIPRDLVSKGIAVVTASSLVIIFMSVVLTASESWAISYTKMPGIYMDALFEIVSAFGTVGLSLGLTAKLSTFGKIVVIFTMLIGRVGPLAIALAVGGEKPVRFKYAEERVMVG